eukprot:11200489-Lingulodinium_polyedra.AAC.1
MYFLVWPARRPGSRASCRAVPRARAGAGRGALCLAKDRGGDEGRAQTASGRGRVQQRRPADDRPL